MDFEAVLQRLIAVAIVILVSFPVHEFSHAFAAYRLGDSTARYQGRLTLNPIAHFDPLGGTLLALSALIGGFFIGWAKPTPVNPYNLMFGRRGDLIVSVAGPLSNLVLAAIVAIPVRLVLSDPATFASMVSNPVGAFVFGVLVYFVAINVVLMIFNLLPIPPLDGWHALLDVVDTRTAYTLRQFEQYGFVLILLLIFVGAQYIGGLRDTIVRFLIGV
jgi:Zn-dependent protease